VSQDRSLFLVIGQSDFQRECQKASLCISAGETCEQSEIQTKSAN
jgi:hypothetical protein